jgi:hypothetical protein
MQFEVPRRLSLAVPDAARVAQIRKTFAESAAPVRLLPSNLAMMLSCVGAFLILAILLTVPVGFYGFLKVTAWGAAVQYSVLLLLALVLAGSAVEQMIPGSRRIMPPTVTVVLAIVLLSVTAALLFPDFATHDFVHRGIPCLRYGVLCAIPAAGFTWLLMRRGFVIDSVRAAIAGGALSGLLGVGVLALHCPILNAAHIIAWHVGVLAVTSLFGAFLGWAISHSGNA